MNPQPADETPLDETAFPLPAAEGLPEQRVEELAAYDEQLRRGEGQTWAAGEPLTTSLPPDLVECLHWIEEVWPRAGKQPAAERELPSLRRAGGPPQRYSSPKAPAGGICTPPTRPRRLVGRNRGSMPKLTPKLPRLAS